MGIIYVKSEIGKYKTNGSGGKFRAQINPFRLLVVGQKFAVPLAKDFTIAHDIGAIND